MTRKLEFVYSVMPYELLPGIFQDSTYSENMIYRIFIKKIYHEIVEEGNTAIYAALKFWLTLDGFYLRASTSRIMPLPMILEDFADNFQNNEINELMSTKNYNRNYYCKLFRKSI